ncbi:MAG TPA: RNA polymerase sigma factor [Polyangiaceae bacterium]|nr:RNA polymerase sigma factor [Polyangiaceae bacterium]
MSDRFIQERAVSEAVLDDQPLFQLVYRQMRSLVALTDRDFDDLVQDAMEQALLARASFEGRSKFSTWTFQICYRTVLKRRRWYARWLKRFSLTHDGELPEVNAHNRSSSESPSELPSQLREQNQRLWAAIERLSPKRRVVVVLHDLEELPCEEIAEVISVKLGTVRSRLRDGRRDLLDLLAQDPFFGERVEVQS